MCWERIQCEIIIFSLPKGSDKHFDSNHLLHLPGCFKLSRPVMNIFMHSSHENQSVNSKCKFLVFKPFIPIVSHIKCTLQYYRQ